MPRVQVIKITRPCGCATPICAIYTNKVADKIILAAHTHQVNQHCLGSHQGATEVRRWLTIVDWIKKYTHSRNRRKWRQELQRQALQCKEDNPRIPETFLI
jgi:hypothetical protein